MNALQIDSYYERLINGLEGERGPVQAALLQLTAPEDRTRLRQRIMEDVRQRFSAAEEIRQSNARIRFQRSWLVNTLARLNDGDHVAIEFVNQHLDPQQESDPWVRYWALEGLIATRIEGLDLLAREVLRLDKHPLLRQTAHAVLASQGNQESLKSLSDEFPNGEKLWATLRALRIVPINAFFEKMAPLVEVGAYQDETYDAIVAMGQAPPGSDHANAASLSLEKFVTKFRVSPMRDGMRLMALRAFGALGIEARAPLLIQEMVDDNPSIAREAARSLEKLLGIRVASARVFEAASKGGPERIEAYGRALRWMKRDLVVEELEKLMDTLPLEGQQTARSLLSEIGGAAAFQKLRASTRAVAQYTEALDRAEARISDMFDRSMEDTRSGFQLAFIMDALVFAVGLLLIVFSGLTVLISKGDLGAWAGVGAAGSGVAGVLGVLYGTFIAKPREQVVQAARQLMRLKLIFLAYLRDLHQIDQAFTRRMLDDKPMPLEEVDRFRVMIEQAMATGAQQLERIETLQAAVPATPGQSKPTTAGKP